MVLANAPAPASLRLLHSPTTTTHLSLPVLPHKTRTSILASHRSSLILPSAHARSYAQVDDRSPCFVFELVSTRWSHYHVARRQACSASCSSWCCSLISPWPWVLALRVCTMPKAVDVGASGTRGWHGSPGSSPLERCVALGCGVGGWIGWVGGFVSLLVLGLPLLPRHSSPYCTLLSLFPFFHSLLLGCQAQSGTQSYLALLLPPLHALGWPSHDGRRPCRHPQDHHCWRPRLGQGHPVRVAERNVRALCVL